MMKDMTYLFNLGIWNTLRINFHYFPFLIAIKLPIVVSRQTRLRSIKGSIKLGKIKTGVIRFGLYNVGLFDNKKSRSIWDVGPGSNINFKGTASFGSGSKLCVMGGELIFGDHFGMTAESTIVCEKNIKFGNEVLISWDTLIMDTDFHKVYKNDKLKNPSRNINIGDNVWIGCRSTILKGSDVPDNSVIAAGTVVTKKLINKAAIYACNPAKLIGQDITWTV